MVKIRVPASSANLGPGYDCLGAALSVYSYMEFEETDGGLIIETSGEGQGSTPRNENNIIYNAMNEVFKLCGRRPKGIRIKSMSDIPLTRGLGSSAACIAGGIYGANALLGMPMPLQAMLDLAAKIEGHPDNSTPCLIGGLCAAVVEDGRVYYVRSEIAEDLVFAFLIPDYYMPTKKARKRLPKNISYGDAVFNTGRSSLLISSLMTGKLENIRVAMRDRMHQYYRRALVPNLYAQIRLLYECGALGAYLSGAGPSVAAIVKRDELCTFTQEVIKRLKAFCEKLTLRIFEPDNKGIIELED